MSCELVPTFSRFLASIFRGILLGTNNALFFFQNGWLILNRVKAHKQQALDEFWTRENETPTGFHRRLLTLYGEDNYGHEYCVSVGNKSEGQRQKFGPE
jgi:hypothetical protein